MANNIEDVVSKYRDSLLLFPNVNGIGINQDSLNSQKYIQVYVIKKIPLQNLHPKDVLPKALDGFNLKVKEIGNISIE